MLKSKRPIIDLAALQCFGAAETFLSELLSFVFDEPLETRYIALARAFEASPSWIVFRESGKGEFAFHLHAPGSTRAGTEYFSQVVRAAQFLAERQPQALKLIPEWSERPEFEHRFSVFYLREQKNPLMSVSVASTLESFLPIVLKNQECSTKQCFGPMPIRCSLVRALQDSRIEPKELKADLVLTFPWKKSALKVRLLEKNSAVQLFIEGEVNPMENELQGCAFAISLGDLELSLEDAVSLRPGMCVEFEAPPVFNGMLLLNGAPWCEADISLENRILRVTVRPSESVETKTDVVDSAPNILTPSKETSGEKLRLVG